MTASLRVSRSAGFTGMQPWKFAQRVGLEQRVDAQPVGGQCVRPAHPTPAPAVGSESTGTATTNTGGGATRFPSSPCAKRAVLAAHSSGERGLVPIDPCFGDDRKATRDFRRGVRRDHSRE